jgi:hypothetical protein
MFKNRDGAGTGISISVQAAHSAYFASECQKTILSGRKRKLRMRFGRIRFTVHLKGLVYLLQAVVLFYLILV